MEEYFQKLRQKNNIHVDVQFCEKSGLADPDDKKVS